MHGHFLSCALPGDRKCLWLKIPSIANTSFHEWLIQKSPWSADLCYFLRNACLIIVRDASNRLDSCCMECVMGHLQADKARWAMIFFAVHLGQYVESDFRIPDILRGNWRHSEIPKPWSYLMNSNPDTPQLHTLRRILYSISHKEAKPNLSQAQVQSH